MSVTAVCYVRYMNGEIGGGGVEGWVLLSISTGKESSLRVFVWRQLRKLGAIYLHQSVCLLPDRPGIRDRLRPVLSRLDSQGGQVRLLSIQVGADEDQGLVQEQQRDRDLEYAEVVERAPQLLAELALETTRGRATYTEVEESEADLERFQKWLAAIAARDYFQAPGGAAARSAVQDCCDALATFETAAVAADTHDSTDHATDHTEMTGSAETPPLRLVDG